MAADGKSKVPLGPVAIRRIDLSNPIDFRDPTTVTLAEVAPADVVLVGHEDNELDISGRITNVKIARTIDGASTVTVTVSDENYDVLNSPAIRGRGTGNLYSLAIIDRLVFQLVGIKYTSVRTCVLTMESESIHRLRGFRGSKHLSRGSVTRAMFLKYLADEAGVDFYCPELNVRQRIQTVEEAETKAEKDRKRAPGFRDGVELKIDGHVATKDQLDQVSRALSVAHNDKASYLPTLAMVCGGIAESKFRNVKNPRSKYSGVFQADPEKIPPADTEQQAHCFLRGGKGFQGGGAIALSRTITDPGKIALTVEGSRSNFSSESEGINFYGQYRDEAAKIIAAFNGGSLTNDLDVPDTYVKPYQFKRLKNEDSWTCMRRLADEVKWYVFEVAGTVYFMSPAQLKQSRPRMLVQPGAEGIVEILPDYDTSPKADNQIAVTCDIGRWSAPPGSVAEVQALGVLDGRWLVQSVNRDSLASTRTQVTLSRFARKVLEPAHEVATKANDPTTTIKPGPSTSEPTPGTKASSPAKGAIFGSPVPGLPPHAPDHETAGLPGYPAFDYLHPAGGPCVAPVDGVIERFSGHDPSGGPTNGVHGPFGWSIYLRGTSGNTSGKDYFLTHLGSRTCRVGDKVKQGDKIGTIGNYAKWGGADHIHMGVHG